MGYTTAFSHFANTTFSGTDAAAIGHKARELTTKAATYALDNSGNRIEESFKDPSNIMRRPVLRDVDALGRIEQVAGRELSR